CFLTCEPWLIADLEATQPLDPDVALPARNDEAHRIPLLRTQHLAVHAVGYDAVVERLAYRDRTIHRRCICALGHDPFCARLEAGLLQQDLQQYARIFHAMHHAMRVLAAIKLGTSPFHAGIGRAFEKIDLADPRQALELIEVKDERLFNE